MTRCASELLDILATTRRGSHALSRGASWCARQERIGEDTIMGYYVVPCGRVCHRCLLEERILQSILLQEYSMSVHQIKTTLAYLDGSVPHNYKFGFKRPVVLE